jgi:hypothetical protein
LGIFLLNVRYICIVFKGSSRQAEAVSRLAMLEIKECNAKIPKASTIVEPTLADFIFKHPVLKNSLPSPQYQCSHTLL